MQNQKTAEILERLPKVYKELAGQKVKLTDGTQAVIKCRVNKLQTKPPLYLWNLTTHSYVSSLKVLHDKQDSEFMFDVRNGEDTTAYRLVWFGGKVRIEKFNQELNSTV